MTTKKKMFDDSVSATSASSSKAASRKSVRSSSSSKRAQAAAVFVPVVEGFKMEVWGEEFQDEMQPYLDVNTVSGMLNATKFPNSFRGDQALDVLTEILKSREHQEDHEVTSSFVLQVGRALMEKYGLFVNASPNSSTSSTSNNKSFTGSEKEIYVFQNNLPIQVYKARKEKFVSLHDRVSLLERELEIKDRKTLTKTHGDCFVAQEAIDCVMKHQLAVSREDAVKFLNNLNAKMNFCKASGVPATSEFKDKKNHFFRFTPDFERAKEQDVVV